MSVITIGLLFCLPRETSSHSSFRPAFLSYMFTVITIMGQQQWENSSRKACLEKACMQGRVGSEASSQKAEKWKGENLNLVWEMVTYVRESGRKSEG